MESAGLFTIFSREHASMRVVNERVAKSPIGWLFLAKD